MHAYRHATIKLTVTVTVTVRRGAMADAARRLNTCAPNPAR